MRSMGARDLDHVSSRATSWWWSDALFPSLNSHHPLRGGTLVRAILTHLTDTINAVPQSYLLYFDLLATWPHLSLRLTIGLH